MRGIVWLRWIYEESETRAVYMIEYTYRAYLNRRGVCLSVMMMCAFYFYFHARAHHLKKRRWLQCHQAASFRAQRSVPPHAGSKRKDREW